MTWRGADWRELSRKELPLARQLEDAYKLRPEEIEWLVPDGRSVQTRFRAWRDLLGSERVEPLASPNVLLEVCVEHANQVCFPASARRGISSNATHPATEGLST